MGDSFWKMVTTVTMWIIMGGISVTSLIVWSGNNMSEEWILMPLVIVPLALAFVATIIIWESNSKQKAAPSNYEKAKRSEGDKYSLLMQMMDDDEREAFKMTLKQRLIDEATYSDGELSSTSLEELMAEKNLRR